MQGLVSVFVHRFKISDYASKTLKLAVDCLFIVKLAVSYALALVFPILKVCDE